MSVLNLCKYRQKKTQTQKGRKSGWCCKSEHRFLAESSLLISVGLFLCSVSPSCLCVYAIMSACVCVCVSKSLFLSHKWVMVWSLCGEFLHQFLSSYDPWHARGPQRPSACHTKRPLSWVVMGFSPGCPSSLFCMEEPFVWGLKSLGMYGCCGESSGNLVCTCVCVSVPECLQ